MSGQQLAGRYRLIDRIAVGGMGEVWRADDEVLRRRIAVKLLRSELADDAEYLHRFRHEAQCAGRLRHPGIAAVLDYGEQRTEPDGARLPWIALELVDGEPLSAVLDRVGSLPVARTLDLLCQVASALDAAHAAGVVHRDIKPGNLLVDADGTVKITDFGVASRGDRSAPGNPDVLLGTAAYLAPEQAEGAPPTAASDVYALGVVGYECLAGRRPFAANDKIQLVVRHVREDPPPLPTSVPTPVADLVLRALAKDPADRPSPAAVLAAEAALLRDELLTGLIPEGQS